MPRYRDIGSIAPQSIQDVLSWMGMRDPRTIVSSPLTTVGPKAIPLDKPGTYSSKVLGETVADLIEAWQKYGNKRIGNETVSRFGRLIDEGDDTAGAISQWLDLGPEDVASVRQGNAMYNDPALVNWLASLFLGGK